MSLKPGLVAEAVYSLWLFTTNNGASKGSAKIIFLIAPVNDSVRTFNYTICTLVSAGQALLRLPTWIECLWKSEHFQQT